MKIIIEGTNNKKYFEKETKNNNWEFVSGKQNSASFIKGKEITKEVNEALNTIFNLANPEEEKEIYYNFDSNREDNQEEEITVLDWLEWRDFRTLPGSN